MYDFIHILFYQALTFQIITFIDYINKNFDAFQLLSPSIFPKQLNAVINEKQ